MKAQVLSGSNFVQQNGSSTITEQVPTPGCLYVKQFGCSSAAGNVGRTGSAKINQDSLFVSKITADGRVLTTKEALKQGPNKVDWFCGVADGHGANGHFVSQFIQAHLPKQYEQDKKKIDKQKQAKDLVQSFRKVPEQEQQLAQESGGFESNEKRIKRCLVSSFLGVQQKLEKQNGFDCSLSGSTVVGVYMKENDFYFANAGDSRAIIIGEQSKSHNQEYMHERGWDASQDTQIVILSQTRDHKPDLADEADRIINHYEGQINNTHAQTLVIQSIQGANSVAPPKPS